MSSQHDADIINKDRQEQAKMMQEELASLGVTTRIQHFTGDSSYPTEYTLTWGNVHAVGPTMDLALLHFVQTLLRSDAVTAYKSMETALTLLTGNILHLRTELLVIKAEVTRGHDEEQS